MSHAPASTRLPSRGLGYEHLCAFVFQSFKGLLPYDRVALGLLEDGGETLWLAGASGDDTDPPWLRSRRGSIAGGTLRAVVAMGQPRIINDLADYCRSRPNGSATPVLVKHGYAASLTAPLRHHDQDLGLLFFNSRAPHVYQSEHAETIRRIARAVAAIVAEIGRNGDTDETWASVLGSSLRSLALAAHQVHEEELLIARVADLVHRGTTLGEVLDAVYSSFSALLPFDRIGFAHIDSPTGNVAAKWARSNGHIRLGHGFAQSIHATSLGGVLKSAAPRIMNDLVAYVAQNPDSVATRLVVAEGMRSSLTYLVGDAKQPIGFLFFNSRAVGAYELDHVSRLRKITGRLTRAFERAILFDRIRRAHGRTQELLDLLVPPPVARRLEAGETQVIEELQATVLLFDLVDFSTWSVKLPPLELFRKMSTLFASFDAQAKTEGVYRIRTMGDGYFAVAGVHPRRPDHADAAARLAFALMRAVEAESRPDGRAMTARIGLHSGPVVAGVRGGDDLQYEVWGPTVTIAARMETSSEPGRIQISEATAALLGGRLPVELRGSLELKGIGTYQTYWLEEPVATAPAPSVNESVGSDGPPGDGDRV